jgi:hypothetical protein
MITKGLILQYNIWFDNYKKICSVSAGKFSKFCFCSFMNIDNKKKYKRNFRKISDKNDQKNFKIT